MAPKCPDNSIIHTRGAWSCMAKGTCIIHKTHKHYHDAVCHSAQTHVQQNGILLSMQVLHLNRDIFHGIFLSLSM